LVVLIVYATAVFVDDDETVTAARLVKVQRRIRETKHHSTSAKGKSVEGKEYVNQKCEMIVMYSAYLLSLSLSLSLFASIVAVRVKRQ
jgi:hypothetical protein